MNNLCDKDSVCVCIGRKRESCATLWCFYMFCVLNQSESNVIKTEVVFIVSIYFKSVLK